MPPCPHLAAGNGDQAATARRTPPQPSSARTQTRDSSRRLPMERRFRGKAPMRRFILSVADRAIDFSHAFLAGKPRKTTQIRLSGDAEYHALGNMLAVAVEGPQEIGSGLERVRKPDPD